jgi:hypothetical protein
MNTLFCTCVCPSACVVQTLLGMAVDGGQVRVAVCFAAKRKQSSLRERWCGTATYNCGGVEQPCCLDARARARVCVCMDMKCRGVLGEEATQRDPP